MDGFDYLRAESLTEAVAALADGQGRVLAGGTDLLVSIKRGEARPRRLVDISRVPELRVLDEEGGRLRFGAGVTFAELASSPLARRRAWPLAQAAEQIGSPQIRQVATLGGNVANGSPAADAVVPLLALGASLRVRGARGERTVPLEAVLAAEPGRVALEPDELIVAAEFPPPPPGARGVFLKLGRRNAMNIARLSLSFLVIPGPGGTIAQAALAVGAAGPHPFRAAGVEDLLRGARPTPGLRQETEEQLSQEVARRLGDRPSGPYKRYAIRGLFREAWELCLGADGEGDKP